jgi:hypothetical protein
VALRLGEIVLVDTNVLIEAYKVGCLRAIAPRYKIHTVEKCIEETQTGFQRRKPEEQIDQQELRGLVSSVANVTPLEEATLILSLPNGPFLDDGERHLLAHAAARKDAWHLCGPDKALIRAAHNLGWLDRIVSLEEMADKCGVGPRQLARLGANYKKDWLSRLRTELILAL